MRLAPGRSGALPSERGALLQCGLVQRERGSDAHRVALPATDGPATAQGLANTGVLGALKVVGEQAGPGTLRGTSRLRNTPGQRGDWKQRAHPMGPGGLARTRWVDRGEQAALVRRLTLGVWASSSG